MAANKHIEQIGDLDANIRANLDTLQIAIQTDDEETFVWADEGADKYFYAARQYSKVAGGAKTYLDNEFNKVTLHGNLIIPDAGNIGSVSDTDAIAIGAAGIVSFSAGINNSGASLLIQDDAAQGVELFASAGGGETPTLQISGFRNVDAQRTLSIGISAATNDSVDFTGVSDYIFDGDLNIPAGGEIGCTGDFDLMTLTVNLLTVAGAITATGVITGNSFITASDIGIAGDTDLIQLTAADTMQINGQLGVNIAPGNNNINSYWDVTNANGYHSIYSIMYSRANVNGSYNNRAGHFITYASINAGVTNSGTLAGLFGSAQHISGGTISKLFGLQFSYGNTTTGGAGKVSTTVTGIDLSPLAQEGTVTTLNDIRISSPLAGGVITNEWCIFSDHAAACRFVEDIQIVSDGDGVVLGGAGDSSAIDDGSDMVMDFDLLNATGRSLIIKENAVEIAHFDNDGLEVAGVLGREGHYYAYASAEIAGVAAWTTLDLDTVVEADANCYSEAAGVVTIQKDGLYRIGYSVNFQLDTGTRYWAAAGIYVNAGAIEHSKAGAYVRIAAIPGTNAVNTITISLNATDTVELKALVSNIATDIGGYITEPANMWMEYIRDDS